ncbi:CBS domain-containing protein [Mastigocoleus testarum]|uniref:Histidine kinase n=1 Tax=Mastigocoleus testarum BC008 TaxID=371196 RepID=A0A0V7ZUL4_9CYAN|nr:CBS domain-containing protein [Mastigocoleus testarum]KST68158.1 hypothetical protein BC008_32575 [Mastigocoleus testarum BC008]KST68821.1 hypothetical protein BC008_34260 [Mastigocoleus testarum BC008]
MSVNQWFSLEKAIEREPLIVTPDITIVEVIGLMSQGWVRNCPLDNDNSTDDNFPVRKHSSSCAVVVHDGLLVGIFTERDVVRLIAAGRTLQGITIAEVMSRELVTLKTDRTNQDIFAARNLMHQHGIRHLPIMDECDQLLGIISSEGIRRQIRPTQWLRFCKVAEVMNSQVVHAPLTVSLMNVIKLMANHHVSCVVLVQKVKERVQKLTGNEESSDTEACALLPIGIITERDILQFQRLELNLEFIQAQAVMSAPLFLINPEDSLWAVQSLMDYHKVRRLVVASSQAELRGIITQTSLLQALDPTEMYEVLELLEQKVEELETEKRKLSESYTTQSQLYQQTQKALEESHKVEKSLRKENNLISTILDVAAALIVVLDKEGKILSFNQACEIAIGYSFEEVESKQVWDLIVPEEIETTIEVFEQLQRGEFPIQYDNHWIAKDGSLRLITWSNTCLIDNDGSVNYIIATGIDITRESKLRLSSCAPNI